MVLKIKIVDNKRGKIKSKVQIKCEIVVLLKPFAGWNGWILISFISFICLLCKNSLICCIGVIFCSCNFWENSLIKGSFNKILGFYSLTNKVNILSEECGIKETEIKKWVFLTWLIIILAAAWVATIYFSWWLYVLEEFVLLVWGFAFTIVSFDCGCSKFLFWIIFFESCPFYH